MSRFQSGKHDGCTVIAEAGINHNGQLQMAKKMIDAAAAASVDAVKFQTFQPEEVVSEQTQKASYQERSTSEDQYEMLVDKTLTEVEYEELFEYCEDQGVEFLSTPYDPESVSLLDSLGVEQYKIASADIVNKPLLKAVADTGNPVILSTGMASLGEIERAVDFLRDSGSTDITLLHCISDYPADPADVNLRFIRTLNTAFDLPVGFSDHTTGVSVPTAAATLGATVIEKHFTLDRSLEGPDHAASLEPDELDRMVTAVETATEALGDGTCTRVSEEHENEMAMRRSLHARHDLSAETEIEENDLAIIRPYEGLDPWEIDDVVGKTLTTDVEANAPITRDLIQ